MLSYRHAFHAGNFADVLKHVVLVQVLQYLTRKTAPLLYIDTHAGAGEYDLSAGWASRTGEFREGVGALWADEVLPGPLEDYLGLLRALNPDGPLRRYPGSPKLAQMLLRDQDRLELCELHGSDFSTLAEVTRTDRRVHCHGEDGFRVAIARLPPARRRGLVLVDPSYEVKDDYRRVIDALEQMYRRFATGVYLLWYPIVDRRSSDSLSAGIRESRLRNVLWLELVLNADPAHPGLRGCGMFVVNPPWTLEAAMEPVMRTLVERFAGNARGRASITGIACD